MTIIYTHGDATAPPIDGKNRIIAHVCNNKGGWGAGFVLAISKRWPQPEAQFRRLSKAGQLKLGDVQLVHCEPFLYVANMIAQDGFGEDGQPPIRYTHLRTCLQELTADAKARNASVHMPRIGCGLAGGKWEAIEPLINDTLIKAGIPVTVYDYP